MYTPHYITIFAAILLASHTCAQEVAYFDNSAGKPVLFSKSNLYIEGSPFLFPEYRLAEATTNKNQLNQPILTRLDLYTGQITYSNINGQEMKAGELITQLFFMPLTADSNKMPGVLIGGYPAINTATSDRFQVLDTGKINLVRVLKIGMTEEKPYGQAGVERKYKLQTHLAILNQEGKPEKVPASENKKLSLFSLKEKEIASYINKNQLNLKKEDDLIRLISYYNSLF